MLVTIVCRIACLLALVSSNIAIGSELTVSTPDINSAQPAGTNAPAWLFVQAGHLLAVPGHPFLGPSTVVIHDGVIIRVAPGFVGPDSEVAASGKPAQLVDLRNAYVLPGLIDAHVHLQDERILENVWEDRIKMFRYAAEYRAFRSIRNALTVVEHGFTTVRSAGDGSDLTFAMRQAALDGYVVAPRLRVAGAAIGPTGTQNDPQSWPFRSEVRDFLSREERHAVCDGVEDCRRAVRYIAARGAEWLKIKASGGVEVLFPNRRDPRFFKDELDDMVNTAHDLGLRVMAHAISAESIKRCLRAGVDSIEHGSTLDDEAIGLFKQKGAYLVPTLLAVSDWAAVATDSRGVPPSVVKSIRQAAFDSVRRAYKAGVPIALGSDTGFSPHARGSHEFELLVEAGLTPTDAIRAGTTVAARLLGLEQTIGTLEVNKAADLVATESNPLEDISELTRVKFVMQGGVVRLNKLTHAEDHQKAPRT
jgi:imidazolonepropionase-like amidohydrolase